MAEVLLTLTITNMSAMIAYCLKTQPQGQTSAAQYLIACADSPALVQSGLLALETYGRGLQKDFTQYVYSKRFNW